MEWQYILTLVIITPVIFVPVAFIWYIIIKGTYQTMTQSSRKKQGFNEAVKENGVPAYYLAGNAPCVSAAMGHVRKRTPYQPCRYDNVKGKEIW